MAFDQATESPSPRGPHPEFHGQPHCSISLCSLLLNTGHSNTEVPLDVPLLTARRSAQTRPLAPDADPLRAPRCVRYRDASQSSVQLSASSDQARSILARACSSLPRSGVACLSRSTSIRWGAARRKNHQMVGRRSTSRRRASWVTSGAPRSSAVAAISRSAGSPGKLSPN